MAPLRALVAALPCTGVLLAVLVAASAPAAGQTGCDPDRLGNLICRPAPAAPSVRTPGRRTAIGEAAGGAPAVVVPAMRIDATGRGHPPRRAVTGLRPFAEAVPPGRPAALCRRDLVGTVVCP